MRTFPLVCGGLILLHPVRLLLWEEGVVELNFYRSLNAHGRRWDPSSRVATFLHRAS